MACYRLLLAELDPPGFLDEATFDQECGALLIAREYGGNGAIELWLEPSIGRCKSPANDNDVPPKPADS
jgi:hypothetical protein